MVKKISVIVPAYNESETLKKNIPILHKYITTRFQNAEIIIADDGSTDETKNVVQQYARVLKNIRYVGYTVNKGKGANLTNAFQHATGEIQLFIDADLDIKKELIVEAVNLIDTADIVIASKHHKRAEIEYPLTRKITSLGFVYITRILFGTKITDFQCGLKAFKKEAIYSILPHIRTQGFLWDTEVLVHGHKKKYIIKEIPAIVHSIKGRTSTVRITRDSYRMFRDLIKLWWRMNI